MAEDDNILGFVFVGTFAVLTIASVIGCAILLYDRFRSAAPAPGPSRLWRFVVACGVFSALSMLALYLKGLAADQYAGMILLASIPYFIPMAVAGAVALFLRPRPSI